MQRWQINIQKDSQNHPCLRNCKLKQHDTGTNRSEWLKSKALTTGTLVQQELSLISGGNAQ